MSATESSTGQEPGEEPGGVCGIGATVISAHSERPSGCLSLRVQRNREQPAAQHLAVRMPGAAVRRDVEQIGRGLRRQRHGIGAEQRAEGVVGGEDQAFVVDDGHRKGGGPEDGPVVGAAADRPGPTDAVSGSACEAVSGPVRDPVRGTVSGPRRRGIRMTLRDRRSRGRGRCACRGPRPFGGFAHRSLPPCSSVLNRCGRTGPAAWSAVVGAETTQESVVKHRGCRPARSSSPPVPGPRIAPHGPFARRSGLPRTDCFCAALFSPVDLGSVSRSCGDRL